MTNNPFEDKLRAALETPAPDNQFVATLRAKLGGLPKSQDSSWERLRTTMWFRPVAITFSVLVVLMVTFFAIGPNKVLAAVRGALGFIPGIGFVDTGSGLRVLAEPVRQERDGIVLTVQEALIDAQHTVIKYQVEGITRQMLPVSEDDPGCYGPEVLLLPDGSFLTMIGGSGAGWGSGNAIRVIFDALPPSVMQATLMVPCLQGTRTGATPENWQIPLRFKAAPADLTVMPVAEIATLTPTLTQPQPTQSILTQPPDGHNTPTITLQPEYANPYGITVSVTKILELGDSYLLQGKISWVGQSFGVDFSGFEIQLTDANGKRIPAEPYYSNFPGGETQTEKQTLIWAMQTGGIGYPTPWTLTISTLLVDKAANVPFEVDLGADPQPGTVWNVNLDLQVEGYTVRVKTIDLTLERDGYWLNYTCEGIPAEKGGGIPQASITDLDNHTVNGGGRGGPCSGGALYDAKPTGIHHFIVSSIGYSLSGPWTVKVDLPSPSGQVLTSTPASQVCLDQAAWGSPGDPGAVLPEGKLLIAVASDQPLPMIFLANLDGSERQEIGLGAWASLSPDGLKVAYASPDGINVADVQSKQSHLIPGTVPSDWMTFWSPDGEWIAFNRSTGEDGTYITHPDGSGMRRVDKSALGRFLAGWFPDGKHLLVAVQGEDGKTLQSVDIESGESKDLGSIPGGVKGSMPMISPDGQWVVFGTRIFGQNGYGVYIARLDGSGLRLVVSLDSGSAWARAWSSDGKWLAVTVYETINDVSVSIPVLVNIETCQVIRLDNLEGEVDGWWSPAGQ